MCAHARACADTHAMHNFAHRHRQRIFAITAFFGLTPPPPPPTAPSSTSLCLSIAPPLSVQLMLNLIVFGAHVSTGALAHTHTHTDSIQNRLNAFLRMRPLQSCTSTCGPQASIYSPRARERARARARTFALSLSVCARLRAEYATAYIVWTYIRSQRM